jgi:F-type H+-transporting ATPase subunit b
MPLALLPIQALALQPILALASSEEGGGFNPVSLSQGGGFFWTLVIFAVAAPFIWKIVMGPIARALEERDGKVARAIEEAQKAAADAQRARADVEAKVAEARAESARYLAEARDRAAVRERELVEEASAKAQALLDAARSAIRAEQDKAIAAIRDEVVDLALSGASKVLGRNAGSEDDRRLVTDLVQQSQALRGPARAGQAGKGGAR